MKTSCSRGQDQRSSTGKARTSSGDADERSSACAGGRDDCSSIRAPLWAAAAESGDGSRPMAYLFSAVQLAAVGGNRRGSLHLYFAGAPARRDCNLRGAENKTNSKT
jgi:hypothetical protein